jgi:glucose-6-phosphate dehydrogenase assembly protein OpcA
VTPALPPPLDRGLSVPFRAIEPALAEMARSHGKPGRGQGVQARTLTLVAVAGQSALEEAVEAVEGLASRTTVRAILVPIEPARGPARARVRVTCAAGAGGRDTVCREIIVLDGLESPAFIPQAVAALRARDLPLLLWWRAVDVPPPVLWRLSDRIVFDAPDPAAHWRAVAAASAEGSDPAPGLGDGRWTNLTGWRATIADLLDVPELREPFRAIDSLRIEAADRFIVALFAGWLAASLGWQLESAADGEALFLQPGDQPVSVLWGRRPGAGAPARDAGLKGTTAAEAVPAGEGAEALEAIEIDGARGAGPVRIRIRLTPARTCLAVTVTVGGRPCLERVVAQRPAGPKELLSQELQFRGRDAVFEAAVPHAVRLLGAWEAA